MAEEQEEKELSEEELAYLEKLYPREEGRQDIFSFFKRIIGMKDTSRTAFLKEEELGFARIPVRTNQELSLYCGLMENDWMKNAFHAESQITTSTSLSREGFLDKLAVTQKREKTEAISIPGVQKENKGWFKRKEKEDRE